MSASVAFDGGRSGIRLASGGTSRASSEPCASTCATSSVFGGVGDVVAERFGEELIRSGEVLFAMPEQHARAAVERGPGRLGDERGLAQTGLTRDEHTPRGPRRPATRLNASGHRRDLGLAARRRPTPGAPPDGPATGPTLRVGSVERFPPHLDGRPPDRAGPSASSAPTGRHS